MVFGTMWLYVFNLYCYYCVNVTVLLLNVKNIHSVVGHSKIIYSAIDIPRPL